MPEFRNAPDLPSPSFPGSHIAADDRYLFLSGLVASDVNGGDDCIGDIEAETDIVMRTLRRMLESEGRDLGSVVRVDVHLADLRDIEAMDAVYATFFPDGCYPARTCTESSHICGNCRVEITIMARRA